MVGNLPMGVVIICTFGGVLFSVYPYFVLKRGSAMVLNVAAKSDPPLRLTLCLFINTLAFSHSLSSFNSRAPFSFFLSSYFSYFTSIKYPTPLLFLLLNHFLFSSSKYKPSKRNRERIFFF